MVGRKDIMNALFLNPSRSILYRLVYQMCLVVTHYVPHFLGFAGQPNICQPMRIGVLVSHGVDSPESHHQFLLLVTNVATNSNWPTTEV